MGGLPGFYIGEELISDGSKAGYEVVYDDINKVYTVTGLTQDDLGKLGFKQAAKDVNDVEVRAQTVESANGVTSQWTHGDNDSWAGVTTTISKQFGTTVNDTLLWTGEAINGRGGEDTIQLRFGESITSSDLASNLKNIEVIDLSVAGANTIGTAGLGLSIADVLDITDSRNQLTIDGDGEDKVFLDNGWATDNSVTGGYVVYTYIDAGNSANNVTLNIAEHIIVD